MIARTFLTGIALAPLAIIGQWLFSQFLTYNYPGYQVATSASFFLWAAFIEEMVKLLAVRLVVLNNPNFDEPVDAMIYMVTAGLGFAAIENILVIFQSVPQGVQLTLQLWILRFAGATLLHATASGIIGYFLALSWFYRHHSGKLVVFGILLATLIHFSFNYILLTFSGDTGAMLYSFILLVISSSFVSILFSKIKERRAPTASSLY